jgi:exodeoxyribonuclease VII small subunit
MYWRYGKIKKENNTEEKISFENAFKRLEDIANSLENGDIELEKSFELYEEGQKLMKVCQKMLDSAEKKLKIISKEQNNFHVEETDIEQS